MSRQLSGRWGGLATLMLVAGTAWMLPATGAALQQRDVTQAPARDVQTTRAGTAVISGVVRSDEPNGRPVRRAIVHITYSEGIGGRLAMTDEQGRFALTSLPAGRYTLSVNKPGWVRSYYGAKRPWRLPGMPIVVADGQRITNLAVTLVRGAVITGRVRDANGQPLPNARPMVLEFRTIGGVRRLQQVMSGASTLSLATDDRGEYRHFGLPPGTYVIAASPPLVASASGFRITSPADVQWATPSSQAQPGTMAGGAAGPAPAQPTYGYEPTYYPGVSDPSGATTVTLAAGEERTGIDLVVRPVATARVEGTVTRGDGQPITGAQITVTRESDLVVSSIDQAASRSTVDARGRFSVPSVRPGRYTVSARAPSRPPERPTAAGSRESILAAAGVGPMPNAMDLWATTNIVVDGQPIEGLSLVLQPGISISGRVAFEATTLTPPTDLSRLRVQMLPASILLGTGSAMGLSMVSPTSDGSFVITGVAPDRYLIGASNLSGGVSVDGTGWLVKSVMVNGRDVTDGPFDVQAGQDIRDVTITFSDRSSEISGQLVDAKGQPVPGFFVFVFPTDKSAWTQSSRRFRAPVRPDSTGQYRLNLLPPGDYYIAALTDFEEQDIQDAAFIEQIIPAAIKITIGEGEKKVQNIKLSGGN